MKRLFVIFGSMILLTACGLLGGNAVSDIPSTANQPTTTVQASGFTSGTPVDVSTLPILAGVGAGGEPEPCFSNDPAPSISEGYNIFPNRTLCLNHFPTAAGSPGFTVTLTEPLGRVFQETFTYAQDGIFNSSGKRVGSIQPGSGSEGYPATPGVEVQIFMPASFPCGDWLVSAATQDGSIQVASTILKVSCQIPHLSVLPDLNINPFLSAGSGWEGPDFADQETIYTVGTGYPPNTALTLAFYQKDPSAGEPPTGYLFLGRARYAVSLMTDSSGNFQAPFYVDSTILRGAYFAEAAQAITQAIHLYYFDARFSIK